MKNTNQVCKENKTKTSHNYMSTLTTQSGGMVVRTGICSGMEITGPGNPETR